MFLFFCKPICRVVHNHIKVRGEAQMSKEEDLINTVVERAQETDRGKKLACAQAFELAHELGVKVAEIGRICNQQNIRICKCQLGCFP